MESRIAQLNSIAPRRIRAQAALWVTELHGPDRDAALEAKVKRWIAEDPRHAAAFELATAAWQRSGNLAGRRPQHTLASLSARPRARRLGPTLAAAAVLCGVLIAAIYYLNVGIVATGAGEQRTVELSDGTQVSLNANSRLLLQYDTRVRKVTLVRGEALFSVAKHQPRPFVVVIGDRKVIAVGTSFMIRREQSESAEFAVTLMEGRVAVEPISWPDELPVDVNGLQLLKPGERLRFAGAAAQTVDSPSLDKITAWQRGRLIFDNTSLTEAAAEFNRYRANTITIDDSVAKTLRVGGVFRIADPSSFAQAMANAHHLRLTQRGNEFVLDDPKTSRLENSSD